MHLLQRSTRTFAIECFILLAFFGCTPTTATLSPQTTSNADIEVTKIISTQQATKQETQTLVLPETMERGLNIEFWHPWSGETAVAIDKLVETFNTENQWGIRVQAVARGDESTLVAAIMDALEGDTQPDLVAVPDYAIHGWYEQGKVVDLTDIVISEKWGLSVSMTSSIPNVFWRTGLYDTKLISMPAYRSAKVLFYNKTWAEELGFPNQPATIDDFRNQNCSALLANGQDRDVTNNGTGGWFYETDPESVISWLRTFNGGTLPDASNAAIRFAIEENIAGYSYLFDLFHQDCAWIGRDDRPYMYFAGRKTLTYSGRLEDILIQERARVIGGNDDDWIVMPYPGSDEKPIYVIVGDSYAILNPDIQKTLASWEFIKWMMDPEQSAAIIRASGSLPININALEKLTEFRQEHIQWEKALQWLPYGQALTKNPAWPALGALMQDIAWQITQFYQQRTGISTIMEQAETLMNTMN